MKASSDFPSLNVRRPDGLSPEGVPYNILIVDDSIFVKKQLAQILTSENFNVIDMAGKEKKLLKNIRNIIRK